MIHKCQLGLLRYSRVHGWALHATKCKFIFACYGSCSTRKGADCRHGVSSNHYDFFLYQNSNKKRRQLAAP
ncbi:unnamed protein product, partial [Linum tenue]